MSSGASPLDTLTGEERNRLLDAMRNPEFATLLAEYAKDISDPKTRKENDMYLQQLEQQHSLPEGIKLLKPAPLFCIKALHPEYGKLFVNVCVSELVASPSPKKCQGGVNWNIPYSCSTQRPVKTTSSGKEALAVDVTFHSSIAKSIQNIRFKSLTELTALEGAEKVVQRTYNRPYRVLIKCKCKDGPPAIMRLAGDDNANPVLSPPGFKQNPKPDDCKAATFGPTTANTKLQETDDKGNKTECDDNADHYDAIGTSKLEVPSFKIVERGQFQLSDCTLNSPLVGSTRPKFIVVKIDLPAVTHLADRSGVELDVAADHISFEIKNLYAPLRIQLPYTVDQDSGKARFSSTDHVLSVTLPVVQTQPVLAYPKDPTADVHEAVKIETSPEPKPSSVNGRHLSNFESQGHDDQVINAVSADTEAENSSEIAKTDSTSTIENDKTVLSSPFVENLSKTSNYTGDDNAAGTDSGADIDTERSSHQVTSASNATEPNESQETVIDCALGNLDTTDIQSTVRRNGLRNGVMFNID
uniref:PIH1 domain-containing protein 1 n=1 Tax=Spongospora subterranea TaxID=70186 RepID=A0A0H5R668_9EUKA|eukprot:CRZ09628.1 hypothetical protein [Spongospora subterranea]